MPFGSQSWSQLSWRFRILVLRRWLQVLAEVQNTAGRCWVWMVWAQRRGIWDERPSWYPEGGAWRIVDLAEQLFHMVQGTFRRVFLTGALSRNTVIWRILILRFGNLVVVVDESRRKVDTVFGLWWFLLWVCFVICRGWLRSHGHERKLYLVLGIQWG